MVFEGVRNLCLLGGDASQILPGHIMPNSVDHIFVNFPEPPQTNMTEGAVSKNDEFCIENEELCIKYEEFCILND